MASSRPLRMRFLPYVYQSSGKKPAVVTKDARSVPRTCPEKSATVNRPDAKPPWRSGTLTASMGRKRGGSKRPRRSAQRCAEVPKWSSPARNLTLVKRRYDSGLPVNCCGRDLTVGVTCDLVQANDGTSIRTTRRLRTNGAASAHLWYPGHSLIPTTAECGHEERSLCDTTPAKGGRTIGSMKSPCPGDTERRLVPGTTGRVGRRHWPSVPGLNRPNSLSM